MNCEWVFAFRKSDEACKKQRRLLVQHLSPNAVFSFHERQLDAAHAMLRVMLNHESSKNLEESLKYNSSGLILAITYGYEVKPENDEFVELVSETVTQVTRALHSSFFLVNNFLWLKYVPAWFPGSKFRIFAEEARKNAISVRDIPFEYCKATIEAGTAKPSFMGNVLAASNDETSDARRIQDIKEIASVMFTDKNDLPYIEAIVKEVMRWWQPLPMGIAHCSMEDDVYRGYKIPKGSRIIANVWGILHDESIFPQPNEFRPERFLASEKNSDIICDPALSGFFGWGRRICPGQPLAEASLWIQIASILAAFRLDPAKDEMGKEIDVSLERDFKCK
ncbi:hypothetical protein M422DRAFT_249623 [Sphaerobolus stellatus SS14]|uniref:Unplaced genomic scaffold SPHSTscaffold_30, whole genome shotgun sequence n=1 Tax=Sphaerobolus stellatus (strain SS14) TaxID=990650 RepID=A0A0C9VV14_SPHS4|nr:hypothetical protein M422DRAFT_269614 [Sphaerobolus stellatus SS14]KIJ46879.1 hypothetical protein M422DRAFT_249623 [Sphaerobolus stellatus SS14]